MVPDNVDVLRLVWHPIHFDSQGKLKTSAFPSADVLALLEDGKPRYLSVDDSQNINRASVDWRLAYQQREGRREREHRHDAKFVRFSSGEIRRTCWQPNVPMFEVLPEPTRTGEDGPGSPANDAHCGIHTQNLSAQPLKNSEKMSRGEERSFVERMRTKLMLLKKAVHDYNEIFPDMVA